MKRLWVAWALLVAVGILALGTSALAGKMDSLYRSLEKYGFVPVPKTGQTFPLAIGDDGDLQKGIPWPNPRFTDNEDGTVTDNLTFLVWMKDANCIATFYSGFDEDWINGDGKVSWQHALDFVAGINDGTYSLCGAGYTDWRLPNLRELQSLIHYGFDLPALPNTVGTEQWTENNPFVNLPSSPYSPHYWSSTSHPSYGHAYSVNFSNGLVNAIGKNDEGLYVWCVRDAK